MIRILAAFLGLVAVGAAADPISLTLDQARETALRNHPRVAAARLGVAIAEQAVIQTRSGFLPAANAYVDAVAAGNENTRILAGGLNNPSIYDRTAGGLGMTQLLTDFGRTGNLTASAKLQVRAQGDSADAIRAQILLIVDIDYFGALQTEALAKVARQTLSTRQELVDQVTALAAQKLKSELDVSFAQVALEEGSLLVQKADADNGAAQASLGAALGDRGSVEFILHDVPASPAVPEDYAVLLGQALHDRPEIRQLQDERDASRRFARAEKDLNYPTIAAVGAVGDAPSHDIHVPEHYAAGGILLNVPIFAGGLYAARAREAELKAEVADENLRDAQDEVTRDVRTAWLNLNTAAQRLRTTEQLLKHANESFDLAQALYKIGGRSIVELSQAQLAQTSAEIALVEARYDTLIQRSMLDFQIGRLK